MGWPSPAPWAFEATARIGEPWRRARHVSINALTPLAPMAQGREGIDSATCATYAFCVNNGQRRANNEQAVAVSRRA